MAISSMPGKQGTPREARSAEEIQAEVRRLVDSQMSSSGHDNPGIAVPLPERLPEAGADECNWEMTYFGHAVPHPEVVEAAVADVRARWNMR